MYPTQQWRNLHMVEAEGNAALSEISGKLKSGFNVM